MVEVTQLTIITDRDVLGDVVKTHNGLAGTGVRDFLGQFDWDLLP